MCEFQISLDPLTRFIFSSQKTEDISSPPFLWDLTQSFGEDKGTSLDRSVKSRRDGEIDDDDDQTFWSGG